MAKVSPFDVIKKFEVGDFGALREDYIFTFVRKIAEVFANNAVVLSDDREGVIVRVDQYNLAHPLIYCEKTAEFVDLAKNRDISIVNVI